MPEFELTSHARDMLIERRIAEEWIWRVLNHPDKGGWARLETV